MNESEWEQEGAPVFIDCIGAQNLNLILQDFERLPHLSRLLGGKLDQVHTLVPLTLDDVVQLTEHTQSGHSRGTLNSHHKHEQVICQIN